MTITTRERKASTLFGPAQQSQPFYASTQLSLPGIDLGEKTVEVVPAGHPGPGQSPQQPGVLVMWSLIQAP